MGDFHSNYRETIAEGMSVNQTTTEWGNPNVKVFATVVHTITVITQIHVFVSHEK